MRKFLAASWAIVKEARTDNITGEAAKTAYYFFLSFWPLLLGLFAFTGLFGGEPAFDWIMAWLTSVLPPEPTRFLEEFVREITAEERPQVLSLGVALTLWSGSSIFVSLAEGLNRMYDVAEGRPWWKRRLIAIGILLCASILVPLGATTILAGAEILARFGLGGAWNVARWPLAYLALTALVWLIYYHLPNRKQRLSLRPVTIGALIGTLLWVIVTTGFRIYVTNWGSYGSTYGLVGGVLVLLVWLYLTALAILFGGEIAVSLEQGIHRRRRR